MEFRDLITSHLREDTRILASMLAARRVYCSPFHQVYLCIYSGLLGSKALGEDLVTSLVVFPEERLRIMIKLWTAEVRGDRDAYIEQVVELLKKKGQTPMHLIRDAKRWTRQSFTPKDLAAFKTAGFDPNTN